MNSFTTFWRHKKVLITGDTGFKGSWLALYCLKMGAYVHGVSDIRKDAPILYLDLHLDQWSSFSSDTFDLRDKEKLRTAILDFSPDIIFHLAAQPLVIEGYNNPIETWDVNLMGSLYLLESSKELSKKCVVIMVTTDKVYKNLDQNHSFVETDTLGGFDPYSASKSCVEIMIDSWRNSFYLQYPNLRIASVRSGNVIGGGDYAKNRIVPDAIHCLSHNQPVKVRNPNSVRPWQHVLDSLHGYLTLARKLYISNINKDHDSFKSVHELESSFNFGPTPQSRYTVAELVESMLITWPGNWDKSIDNAEFKESNLLSLSISKSCQLLNWFPIWNFSTSVEKTTQWYLNVFNGKSILEACLDDINSFMAEIVC